MRQLFLLLFTAVVSFFLGIVIGRGSAPVQPIIKVTMPMGETLPVEEQNLNFYKALPKGETTALGSGINHRSDLPAAAATPPPTTASQAVATVPATPDEITEASPITTQKSVKKETNDSWMLQAASTSQEKDAQTLGKRLRSKGFKTEIKPVLIKGKTWFRVYVGPYDSATAAKAAAAKLSREERLTPIARKI